MILLMFSHIVVRIYFSSIANSLSITLKSPTWNERSFISSAARSKRAGRWQMVAHHYDIKGIVSPDEYFFWRLITINRYFLYSVHALILFKIFRFSVDEETKFKVIWNYLLICKILPVTRFKDAIAAILTLKLLTEILLWSCNIIPKAACYKFIIAHFP